MGLPQIRKSSSEFSLKGSLELLLSIQVYSSTDVDLHLHYCRCALPRDEAYKFYLVELNFSYCLRKRTAAKRELPLVS